MPRVSVPAPKWVSVISEVAGREKWVGVVEGEEFGRHIQGGGWLVGERIGGCEGLELGQGALAIGQRESSLFLLYLTRKSRLLTGNRASVIVLTSGERLKNRNTSKIGRLFLARFP
jgi:hypothetical protein